MRIGLFGGTFDPPHRAHVAATMLALKRLRLDRVWWLVTPGNPLKDTDGLAPLAQRIAAAKALTRDPRIDVTGFEADLGVRYSYDTIAYLRARCPGVRFVWIMGADNLRSFHRWQKWRGIADLVPIAVIDRLGPSLYSMGAVASQALARARIRESAAASLADRAPPAWVFVHGLKSPLSSTALRAQRGRGQEEGQAEGHEERDADGLADAHGDGSRPSHKSAAESVENGSVVAPTAVTDAAGDPRRARRLAPGT